jgi:putative membrane protein
MLKSFAGMAVIALMVAGTSCARSPKMAEAPKSVSGGDRVTDANIAAIVVAANNADIAYANMALNKAVSPEVRAFAQRMIADHGGVNSAVTELVTRLGVTPVENSISLDLRDKAEVIRDRLRERNGVDFDRDYIDNEIEYHQGLLRTIDETLMPSASNEEVKGVLRTTRPAVAAHLEHAKRIRPSLR